MIHLIYDVFMQTKSSRFLKELGLQNGGATISLPSSVLLEGLSCLHNFCNMGNYQSFKGTQQVDMNPT